MDKPGTALHGVAGGADPLKVVVPAFSVKAIRQSTPVSGATNKIMVTLTASYGLAHGSMGSTVTISGLTGAQTPDNTALSVTTCGGRLGTTGAWTQGDGTLVLTAAAPGLETPWS